MYIIFRVKFDKESPSINGKIKRSLKNGGFDLVLYLNLSLEWQSYKTNSIILTPMCEQSNMHTREKCQNL